MTGTIEAIFLAPEKGADLHSVDRVRVLVGFGLEGDRYALGAGSMSRWPGAGRAVTLIEAEVIEDALDRCGLDLSNGRSRRNIVTRGIRLNELVGKRFRVGGVLMRGDRLCEPCGYLERRIGEGTQEMLKGRCGLRADVIEEGEIGVGDAVVEA